MPYADHQAKAQRTVTCAVITVSDTRTPDTDKSGQLIHTLLERDGHAVGDYRIIKDDPAGIVTLIRELADNSTCDVVLCTGGTGLAPRDTTFEAIDGLLEKRLPGFGELFRSLSYDEIGSGAMLSRATAGVFRGRILFSMPGSTGAVRLAMEKLILPELGHMAWLLGKD